MAKIVKYLVDIENNGDGNLIVRNLFEEVIEVFGKKASTLDTTTSPLKATLIDIEKRLSAIENNRFKENKTRTYVEAASMSQIGHANVQPSKRSC